MATQQTFIQGPKLNSDFIPGTYSDMFQHYYTYVVKMVTKLGIDPQNAEDVAMTILSKFIEKDALADFDPDFQSSYGGVKRTAKFRTFLSGFVATYVQHHRTRQMKQAYREMRSTNQPVVSDSSNNSGDAVIEWIELYGPNVIDEHEDLAEQDLIRQIRTRLTASGVRNNQDRCNLADFFEAVLEQSNETGKVDVTALSVQFGVSKTTIQNWIKRLRSEVSVVVEVV